MRSVAFKLALTLFQALWLLMVLPGHTRGFLSFTKPGAQSSSHSCCEVGKDSSSHSKTPTDEQKKRCAVCYYAVGLSTPPLIDLELPDLGLLQLRPLVAPVALAEQQHILTYYACGPPAFRA